MICRGDGRQMPRGGRLRARNSHTATNARRSAPTMPHGMSKAILLTSKSKGAVLKSKSKGAALKSKSKNDALKSKSKGAALKSKSKSAVCATNRRARNVSVANGKFLSAPP
jgi:hypothetical protein